MTRMDANERHRFQGRKLRDYRRMLRGLQREGLWLPRTGLSRVPANRVRASTHPGTREASADPELSRTHPVANLSSGFRLLRQNHCRAEIRVRPSQRTSRPTPELPACYGFPTRPTRELRPSSAIGIRAHRKDGAKKEQ